MKTKNIFIAIALVLGVSMANAQPSSFPSNREKLGGALSQGLDMKSMETSFVLNVNPMDAEKKDKLNKVASNYRSRSRSVLSDLEMSMIGGGVGAIVNVVGNEIISLTQVRSKQRKLWQEMRQKECTFIDSIQSVKGQNDFYGRQSVYGPGVTLCANRGGQEVLRMVCHIDTTKFDHLFLHSKFYLVLDSLVFYPYRSFLPNLKANRINKPRKNASKNEIEYWNTISQFSFSEYQQPTINIQMDLFSSWINELVQVYKDVKLGSFSVSIPVNEKELNDSVYIYCRETAIAQNRPTIDIYGDCFVVPRSYMPVAANNPSWGTGEYKMKVLLSEKCRYNPDDKRSKRWHRDYKQLVRLQNNGKAKNDYWTDVVTTFRDNKNTILKATYTPALNKGVELLNIPTSGSGMSGGGMSGSKGSAQGNSGASTTGAPSGMGGGNPPMGRP